MASADGQIVLGLNVNATQANIQSELDRILSSTKLRKIVLEAAIEKGETEKSINALVESINKKTAKLGVKVDAKDVSSILSQQQKIASTQDNLTRKMQEYRNIAKDIGITLNKSTWNAFNQAIKAEDFEKANGILKSAKKQIDDYNRAVRSMNSDTKVAGSVSSIVDRFSQLKNVSSETQKRIALLKANFSQFENADNTKTKLAAYKRLQTTIAQLITEYQQLKSAESTSSGDSGIRKKVEDAKTLQSVYSKLYSTADGGAGGALKTSIQELDVAIKNFESSSAGLSGGKLAAEWEKVAAAIQNATRMEKEYKAEQSVTGKLDTNLTSITGRIQNAINSVSTSGAFGAGADDLKESLGGLLRRADEVRTKLADLDPSNGEDVKNLRAEIEGLNGDFSKLSGDVKTFGSSEAFAKFSAGVEKARQKVEAYDKTYSAIKGNPALMADLANLRVKVNEIKNAGDLKNFNAQFDQFNAKVAQAGLNTTSLGDKLKSAFSNFAYFFSASRMIYEVIAQIKAMIANVTALDSAMVELRKVTEATDSQFDSFLSRAKDTAVELGSTVVDVVNSTADFSRLGFSLDEAEELSKVATVYKNVGDDINSIDDASSIIITAMKAFNIEASDSISIIDKLNEVGNNFAISSGDLGEGLTRAASYMATAGNSIDQTIALITAMTEITQDASESGNALKILAMRLRGAKTEIAAAGESTEGMAESTSKLREQIMALTNVSGKGGFDIMLNENEFKSTYDIMKGISEVWNDMSDINQAALIETIAGKQRGNSISALLTSMAQAENVLTTSIESSGSAMKEQGIWMDSIEAKTNQFKAAFESLSSSTISSGFLKGFLDFGTQSISILDKIISKVGVLPPLLASISTALSVKGQQTVFSPFNFSSGRDKKFSLGVSSFVSKDIEAIRRYNSAIDEAVAKGEVLSGNSVRQGEIISATMTSASKSAVKLAQGADGAEISMDGLTKKLIAMRVSSIAATAAQTALNAALTMGISVGISLLVSAISNLIHYEDNLIQKSEEAADAIEQISSSFKDTVSKVSDIGDRFAELSQGVDQLTGKNKSLTPDDYDEFLDLSNQLADLFPTLSRHYDENGNAIVGLSGDVDTITNSLKDLLDVERQVANQKIVDELPDLYKGTRVKAKDFQEEIKIYENQLQGLENAHELFSGNKITADLSGLVKFTAPDAKKAQKQLDEYTKILDELGVKYVKAQAQENREGVATSAIKILDYNSLDVEETKKQIEVAANEIASKYANEMAGMNAKIQATKNEAAANWGGLFSSISSWLSTDFTYQGLGDELQGVVQSMVNNLNFDELNFDSWEGLQDYISENIVNALSGESSDVQQAFSELFSLSPSDFDSIGDFENKVEELISKIRDSATKLPEDMLENLGALSGHDSTLSEFELQINAIAEAMGVTGDKSDTLKTKLKDLSASDLSTALSIVKSSDIGSYEELISQIDELTAATKRLPQTYETLKASTDNSVQSQTALNDVIADNTYLSEDAYNAITALSDGQFDLSECIDTTNGYLVTNAEMLQRVVAISNDLLTADIKQAAAHEQLNYHNLVMQLSELCDEKGNYTDETLANIDAIQSELTSIEAQIAKYKLLEEQVLGTTTAFEKMESAKQYDEEMDYTDDLADTINSLFSKAGSNEYGTQEFQTAFDTLVPEDVYSQFADVGDQIEAGMEYVNSTLSRYFSRDGDSVSIGFDNIKNFVSDGLANGVFTGTLDDFDLSPGITSVEKLAEKMGLTTEAAFALGNAISKYSADHSNFLTELSSDTLDGQIMQADEELADLLAKREELGRSGKVDTQEWDELTAKINSANKEMSKLRKNARESIKANIDVNSNIKDKTAEVEDLEEKLSELDESDPEYSATLNNYTLAQAQLKQLLADKYELDEPTEVTIQVALEDVQSEIDSTKAKIEEIADCDGDTYTVKAESDQAKLDQLVAELNQLQAEEHEIKAYVGLDDDKTIAALEKAEEFKINDKSFNVIAHTAGANAAIRALNTKLDNLSNRKTTVEINEVTNKTTVEKTPKKPKSGPFVFDGTAHAQGNWGVKQNEKHALVGELGTELMVDPRTGRYTTIGDNGAEFIDIPKGAIIFNHRQTEELLKNGHIYSRGKALVEGNAHFQFIDKTYKPGTTGSSSSSSSSSSNKSNSSSKPNSSTQVTVKATVDNTDLEEQLEDKLKEMADDLSEIIGNFEHSIFMLEKKNGDVKDIVAIYAKMQEAVHDQAKKYRDMGLDENSDYIQDLQKQWWEYRDSIIETWTQFYEDIISSHENAISLTEKLLDNAVETRDFSKISKYTGDIIDHYRFMQETIHDQAEYYRSLGYDETSDEINDLSTAWWDYYEDIKNAATEAWEQVVDAASSAVDDIQSVYDTLHDAANDYASGGYITVDVLQDIISMGAQYMQLLSDENGKLIINEERINAVIAARTQELAIENALAYVSRLRQAAQDKDAASLNKLLYVTNETANATWGLVYSEIEAMKAAGELSEAQYNAAIHNIDALHKLAISAVDGIKKAADATSVTLDDMKSGVDDILQYVMDMLKQEVSDQVDALNDMKTAYQDIIDLRKEALESAKEESDYQDEIADKVKEIAKLQERINALSLDDSRDAQSQKIKLEEEMRDLQKELADKQSDYALDAQEDALDKMADAYNDEKDKEIEILEDSISSYQKLYDKAIAYIESHWDTLIDELISWNTQYGNDLNSTVTEVWNKALEAAKRYGSYVNALDNIQSDIDRSNGDTHNDEVFNPGAEQDRRLVIREMYENSQKYHTEDEAGKKALDERNMYLSRLLKSEFGINAIRGEDGVWYVDKINGERLYDKYKDYIYHTGGVAGDRPTLKQNEIFATLEKGEAILDGNKQDALYRIIDFTTVLSDKFSKLLNQTGLPELFANTRRNLLESTEALVSGKSQNYNITFGDVIIYGSNEDTIEQHREINRQFTNEILGQLGIRR